jgi:uncharacterized membrane protein YphA (DoxX/SURF4 family)
MERLWSSGRVAFGVAFVGLGLEQFVCAHTNEAVLPVLPWVPANPALAYLAGAFLLASGLALVSNFKLRLTGMLLGTFLVVCMLILQLPQALEHPASISIRTVVLEPLALGAAAWTLALSMSRGQNQRQRRLDRLLGAGRWLFAGSMIVFGIDHLLIPGFIASLIPPWFPGALFWAYFTGVALIAAGVSIAASRMDRWAATLLGTMFLIWFLFLHIPRLLSPPASHNPDEWSSALIALAMCGASWLMLRAPRPDEAAT